MTLFAFAQLNGLYGETGKVSSEEFIDRSKEIYKQNHQEEEKENKED